jgi:hypothetical protein
MYVVRSVSGLLLPQLLLRRPHNASYLAIQLARQLLYLVLLL